MHAVKERCDEYERQEPRPALAHVPDELCGCGSELKDDNGEDEYPDDARDDKKPFHVYGVTSALISSSSDAPEESVRTMERSIAPTPAGPCAFGSKTTRI